MISTRAVMLRVTTLALSSLSTGVVAFTTSTTTSTSTNNPMLNTATSLVAWMAFTSDEKDPRPQPPPPPPPSRGRPHPLPHQRKQQQILMSQALPFLKCPETLVDCDFAGNAGFDPLGLAKNKELLWKYREAEIKHARLAMLATVAWPASELWHRAIVNRFELDSVDLDATMTRASSIWMMNGGLQRVSPIWWGFCLGLSAAIDMYGLAKARRGDTAYQPGYLGFDPMALYPDTVKGRELVKEAEIKHGRLAMLAVVVYSWEEWVTQVAVALDETPALFAPLYDSVEMLQGAMVKAEETAALLSPLVDPAAGIAQFVLE